MLFVHPVYDAPHRHPSARETRCSAVSSLATGASARAAVRSEGSGKRNERSSGSVRFRPSSVTTPRLGAPMVPVSVWQGRVSFPAQAGGYWGADAPADAFPSPTTQRGPEARAPRSLRDVLAGFITTCTECRKPRSMRTTECASAEGGERMG
jgi:hypothetical protein